MRAIFQFFLIKPSFWKSLSFEEFRNGELNRKYSESDEINENYEMLVSWYNSELLHLGLPTIGALTFVFKKWNVAM